MNASNLTRPPGRKLKGNRVPRYKTPSLQKVYDAILACAADPKSELYLKDGITRHTGAIHRCAFWAGFDGVRSSHNVPGTLAAACYQAGRVWARRQRSAPKPWPTHADGRQMTLGEMTPEQRRECTLAAVRKFERQLQAAAPAIAAILADCDEPAAD